MVDKKYNFIYETKNIITGQIYVGIHSTNNVEDGYMGSGRELRAAISQHGKDNFVVQKKEFFETRSEAFVREKEIVDNTFVKLEWTYNISVGGVGFEEARIVYSETRKKIGKASSKPVLHLLTGIYYDSIKEASIALDISYNVLQRQLQTNRAEFIILKNDYRMEHSMSNHQFRKKKILNERA